MLILSAALCASAGPSVQTSFGKLKGNAVLNGAVHEYLGIPYAEAPIKNLRFASPVDWTADYPDARDATKPGSVCIQSFDGELGELSFPICASLTFVSQDLDLKIAYS
jgi:carboxylesterase type B